MGGLLASILAPDKPYGPQEPERPRPLVSVERVMAGMRKRSTKRVGKPRATTSHSKLLRRAERLSKRVNRAPKPNVRKLTFTIPDPIKTQEAA